MDTTNKKSTAKITEDDINIITCCAEFNGPKEITDAICKRLFSLDDILFAHQQDYQRVNEYARGEWVPGIFKPKANLYHYSCVRTMKDGVTCTLDPDENGNYRLYVTMDGIDDHIIGLCRDICKLTGMSCDVTDMVVDFSIDPSEWSHDVMFASIKPENKPDKTPDEIIEDILFKIPTDEEIEMLCQHPKPKWTVGIVEERLLGSKS